MKLTALIVVSLGIGMTAWTAELGAPGATNAAPISEEAFRDPFATEEPAGRPAVKVPDPWEKMNRAFFRFNDRFYFWVLKPAARGYTKVAPQPFRVCVSRFFANVKFPIRFANNLLQGNFKRCGIETARFCINSTIGLAGFFDPAVEWKLKTQLADFDQTLGYYRIPPGIYLDWPLLGPSSIRGTVGKVGDSMLSPWPYLDSLAVSLAVPPYEILNSASLRLGDYESFKKATFDPYVALRNAYFENRRQMVEQSRRQPSAPKKK